MSSDDGKTREVVVAKERQVEPSNHGLRLSDVVGRAVGSQLRVLLHIALSCNCRTETYISREAAKKACNRRGYHVHHREPLVLSVCLSSLLVRSFVRSFVSPSTLRLRSSLLVFVSSSISSLRSFLFSLAQS